MSDNENKKVLIDKKYFCTKAFSGLSITPSGACAPCCLFERMITKPSGETYKIWEDDLQEIYNSNFMKDVRHKMLKDEPIDACKQCYQAETHGGQSLRKQSNTTEFDSTLSYTHDSTYKPEYIDLKLNNICNLKCRMCQPRDSHLIYNEFKKISEKDSSFQFYSNANLNDPDIGVPLADIPDWSNNPVFFETFRKMLPVIKKISIVGGEPLLLEEVYKLIDICVNEGYASKIFLVFTSNLMHLPLEKLSSQLSKFEQVLFNISLDAVGKELHYIRYPSSFEKIVDNYKQLYDLRSKANISFQFTPTIQVYNVLYVDMVYRFVNKLIKDGYTFSNTPLHLTYLEFPTHLNIRILPKNVREVAVKRLNQLIVDLPELMSRPTVLANLKQLIHILNTEFITNHDYIPEFLNYSKVLDQERNHSGEDYLPELFKLLENVQPHVPIESYHQTRERGWRLANEGKLDEAIKEFEKSILTSLNKDLDLREMGWMKLSLGFQEDSLKLYEAAYKINQKDPYILKSLSLLYKKTKNHSALKLILPDAIKYNPEDSDLLELMNTSEN